MGYNDPFDQLNMVNEAVERLRATLNYTYDYLPEALRRVLAEQLELQHERLFHLDELVPAWAGTDQRATYPHDVGTEYVAADWFVVGSQRVWTVKARGNLADDIRRGIPTAPAESSDIEIAIYLDQFDDEILESVENNAMALANHLGYEDFAITEELKGSIFRCWFGKLKAGASSDLVQKRMAELDRSLTIYTVAKAQAEVDSLNTASVANLIASIAEVTNAVVRVGALTVIKYTDEGHDSLVFVRTLSALEMKAVEKSPGIQRDPRHFFELLATAVYQLSMDEANGGTSSTAIEA